MLKFITQQRRGTTAEWEKSAVIPRQGEIVLEERADGQTKVKIGDGIHSFLDLDYADQRLLDALDTLKNQLDSHVAWVQENNKEDQENTLGTEIVDARVTNHKTYDTLGNALRGVESNLTRNVDELRTQLSDFIGAEAVDGLFYDTNGEVGLKQPYMLYLTTNDSIIEESGVQIISGSGGGGGGSASKLQIQYVTKSPVTVTVNDSAILKFIFSGTDSSGDEILQASATWKLDGKVIEYGTVKSGENEFDATKYLKIGTSKLILTVADDAGNVVTKTWSIQQVELKLESSFNDSITYPADKPIIFDYTPYGAIDKVVHFSIDGKEVLTETVSAKSSGYPLSVYLPEQPHGSHLVDVYMESTVNDAVITSNHVLKDVIWYDNNSNIPVISSIYQDFTAKQYATTNISYTVYDPNDETPEVTIFVDDVEIKTVQLTTPSDVYSYSTAIPGKHTIKLVCGVTEKVLTVNIEKLDIDISPVTVGLVFDFNPVGKSNDDEDRLWKYDNISMRVSDNFDWVNGGYKQDASTGATYFCIKAGTTATIDYKLFGDDAKQSGKEFKLIFKTEHVSDPEAVFLSCLDNTTDRDHIGVELRSQSAKIYGQNGNLELSYSENDKIEFEFNISKLTGELVPMVMGYEDGVSSRPLVYDSTYNFRQNTPKEITLGSTDCDLLIYRFKVYNTSLTSVDILNNFIADALTTDEMISRYTRNQIYDENQQLDPDVLAEKCPQLRVYKLSAPHFTNNKSDKVSGTTIQQIYKAGDPVLDNWICYNAQHSGQGTSSNNYGAAGRNLDFIMNKSNSYFVLGDETVVDKISLTRTSVPVAYLNAKVNIASSNNLTNAILANRYNQFNPYHRPFVDSQLIEYKDEKGQVQKIAPKDTMEFHNCVIFIQESDPDLTTHREFNDTNWHFYAIGNIGDSKKTDNTRATDPDDINECCVEIMDVGLPLSDFPVDTMIDAMGYSTDEVTEEKIYTWAKDENLDILYELQGEFVKTADTEVQRNKAYYTYNNTQNKYVPAAYVTKSNLKNLYELNGSYVKTSDTHVDLNKTYYVDILEQDDFSEDYTYGWRYIVDDEDAEILNSCKQKWIELYRFITRSTDEEFKRDFSNYFAVDSALYYYLFTTRYCMVDNRAKNTFWHYGKASDGSYKWDLCWDYDNDTSLGLNNFGKQVYRYGLEDIDTDSAGVEVFRESDSMFFCRVRDLFAAELRAKYKELEQAGAWEDESFLATCDNWQNEFPEELWRIDIERKYIRTYTSSFINGKGDSQFLVNMCNGRMKYHRRQWERNQCQYMASKYQTTRASGDAYHANFRFGRPTLDNLVVSPNYQLTLTPYSYIYLTVQYGNTAPISVRAVPNVPTVVPYNSSEADIVNVFSAAAIRDFGDLSACYPKTASVGNAIRIKKLTLGNSTPGYNNNVFEELSTGSNALLEELNIENITSLTGSLNLEDLVNLKTIYATGTDLTSIKFANGGKLTYAELPAINTITLTNLLYLTTTNLKLTSFDNVTDLIVESCPNVDSLELLSKCSNLIRLRLTDVNIGDTTYEEFNNIFGHLKGLDASNTESQHAWLVGSAHFDVLTGSQFTELRHNYPYLDITYDELICSVTFYDYNKFTNRYEEVYHQFVYNQGDCPDPVTREVDPIDTPVKASSISTVYTWEGWSTLQDGVTPVESPLHNVSDDLELYPTFKETTRQYVVSFYNNDGRLLNRYNVDYGTAKFIYPEENPKKGGVYSSDAYYFDSWVPAPENITGDLNCYATYGLYPEAIYSLELNDFNYSIESDMIRIDKYKNTEKKIIKISDAYEVSGSSYLVGVVGNNAFSNCGIEYVKLPQTLQTIGANAFSNNSTISEITIPESVKQIGAGAFYGNTGLVDVYFNAISSVVSLNSTSDKTPFEGCQSAVGFNVHIGSSVEQVPNELFRNRETMGSNKFVTTVEFVTPSSCVSIGTYAFAGSDCSSISLAEPLASIGQYAFSDCKFTTVELPKTIKTISSYAFRNNSNLTSVFIPEGINTISYGAFSKSLNIDFKIENNRCNYAWVSNCLLDVRNKQNVTLVYGQSDSVIPEDKHITTIGRDAFFEVPLQNIDIPSGVTKLDYQAFYKCNPTTIKLPDSLLYIESFALYESAATEILLPLNLTTIGGYGLCYHREITNLVIPGNVTSISVEAFIDCVKLETVVIQSNNVTFGKPPADSVKYAQFNGCTNLTHIEVNWSSTDTKYEKFNADAPWGAGGGVDGKVVVEYTDTEIEYEVN